MESSYNKRSLKNIINRSVAISITVLCSICIFGLVIISLLSFFQDQHINEILAIKNIKITNLSMSHLDEHLYSYLFYERDVDINHISMEITEFRQNTERYYAVVKVDVEALSMGISSVLVKIEEVLLYASNNQLEKAISRYNTEYKKVYKDVNRSLKKMINIHNERRTALKNIHNRLKTVALVTFITIISSLCFIIAKNKVLLVKSIFKPLEKLKYAIQKITDGEYGFKINDQYDNELGDLCHIINIMSVEVLKARDSLIEAKAETERFHMELCESHKMASIGIMSSSIAHELSQPLGVILLKSQLISILLDKKQYDKVKKEYEAVEQQILRAKKIIDSLRVISREGKSENKTKENANKLISYVCTLYNDEFRLAGIKLIQILAKEELHIYVSEVQICQVIANIVSNARDAVRDSSSPEITISSWKESDKVLISVNDNGVGISKENLDRIFKPFFTLKDVGKGTGLGLSLCESMIHDNNGNILVCSEEGKGSTFTLVLPYAV